MKDQIDLFLRVKKTYCTSTMDSYGRWLRRFDEFVQKPMDQLSIHDYLSFREVIDKRYSIKYVSLACSALRQFIQFWERRGNTGGLYSEDIHPPKGESASRPIITLTQYERLLAAIPRDTFCNLRDYLFVRLLWDTGARISEVQELNDTDINYDNSSALIRTKKSGRYDNIYWTEGTNTILKDYMKFRLPMGYTGAVFLTLVRGQVRRITTRSMQRRLNFHLKNAGLPLYLSAHSFRHAKAHFILENGGSVKDVADILRHRRPESSFQYLRRTGIQVRNIARKFMTNIAS